MPEKLVIAFPLAVIYHQVHQQNQPQRLPAVQVQQQKLYRVQQVLPLQVALLQVPPMFKNSVQILILPGMVVLQEKQKAL